MLKWSTALNNVHRFIPRSQSPAFGVQAIIIFSTRIVNCLLMASMIFKRCVSFKLGKIVVNGFFRVHLTILATVYQNNNISFNFSRKIAEAVWCCTKDVNGTSVSVGQEWDTIVIARDRELVRVIGKPYTQQAFTCLRSIALYETPY